MKKKNLRIVMALRVESEVILKLYNLKPQNFKEKKYKVYNNKKLNIWLILSGIGNQNSALATKYLYEVSPKLEANIWINIGMAGSNDLAIGSIFNVQKISYENIYNKLNFYTSALFNNIIPSGELVSVDKVERKFPAKGKVYDMEGYGFIKTAEKFCDRELIYIIKIVSDNKKNPPKNFIKTTKHYMKLNLKIIKKFINKLITIVSNLESKDNTAAINLVCEKYHLSFSRKIIITELLEKAEQIIESKKLEKVIIESDNITMLTNNLKKEVKNYTLKI